MKFLLFPLVGFTAASIFFKSFSKYPSLVGFKHVALYKEPLLRTLQDRSLDFWVDTTFDCRKHFKTFNNILDHCATEYEGAGWIEQVANKAVRMGLDDDHVLAEYVPYMIDIDRLMINEGLKLRPLIPEVRVSLQCEYVAFLYLSFEIFWASLTSEERQIFQMAMSNDFRLNIVPVAAHAFFIMQVAKHVPSMSDLTLLDYFLYSLCDLRQQYRNRKEDPSYKDMIHSMKNTMVHEMGEKELRELVKAVDYYAEVMAKAHDIIGHDQYTSI